MALGKRNSHLHGQVRGAFPLTCPHSGSPRSLRATQRPCRVRACPSHTRARPVRVLVLCVCSVHACACPSQARTARPRPSHAPCPVVRPCPPARAFARGRSWLALPMASQRNPYRGRPSRLALRARTRAHAREAPIETIETSPPRLRTGRTERPLCNSPCTPPSSKMALECGFSPSSRPRTYVRSGSVRTPPYRANTCSPTRSNRSSRSARSAPCVSPARS